MKKIDEVRLWEEVQKLLPHLPFTLEISLGFLEQALWPTADSNELKFKGKILSHVLRSHQVKIVKRGGVRYAIFPKRILDEAKQKRSRKLKKAEPGKVLAEAVWSWP